MSHSITFYYHIRLFQTNLWTDGHDVLKLIEVWLLFKLIEHFENTAFTLFTWLILNNYTCKIWSETLSYDIHPNYCILLNLSIHDVSKINLFASWFMFITNIVSWFCVDICWICFLFILILIVVVNWFLLISLKFINVWEISCSI